MRYSICIRTLGYGGEKYYKLLESIKKLSVKPEEIIVVIPEGYKQPKEKIGNEKFVHCTKGMLEQRIVGYESAKSEYVLLLDDDVSFESPLVNKLFESLNDNNADISFPIYGELLPQGRKRILLQTILSSAVPTKKNDKFIKILPSGGYRYPKNLEKCPRDLESESAPGMCVFAKRKVLLDISLREEKWVEVPQYALREDAVLVYKAYLKGYKAIGRQAVVITHLDNAINDVSRELKATYAIGFSQICFWNRFLREKRFSVICIAYWIFGIEVFCLIKGIIRLNFSLIREFNEGLKKGYRESIKYE